MIRHHVFLRFRPEITEAEAKRRLAVAKMIIAEIQIGKALHEGSIGPYLGGYPGEGITGCTGEVVDSSNGAGGQRGFEQAGAAAGDGDQDLRLRFTRRDVKQINRLEGEGGVVGDDDV